MIKEHNRELFELACMGNKDAVDFLVRFAQIIRVWDDLYDGNREHTGEEISDCFAEAMFGLMDNKFYSSYRDQLWPQIALAYNAWMDANAWADNEEQEKEYCAHFVKNYCDEIVMLCAFLIGGRSHMRNVSLTIREALLRKD